MFFEMNKSRKFLFERQQISAEKNLQIEQIFHRERDELIRLHKILKFIEIVRNEFDFSDQSFLFLKCRPESDR